MNKRLIVGNWKMNQSLKDIEDFFQEADKITKAEFWIAPQALHLPSCLSHKNQDNIKIGSQNICHESQGAFTGELAPAAIKELGCEFTLIGHSERRQIFKESLEVIKLKVQRAVENKLISILCVGETLEEREANSTLDIVNKQLLSAIEGIEGLNASNFIVAYEPVWAIGTGKVASPEQAEEVHKALRSTLKEHFDDAAEISILYGGSVKPANVEELMACDNINGALVGGASLKAETFCKLL
jgi:triosephosphate isomerase